MKSECHRKGLSSRVLVWFTHLYFVGAEERENSVACAELHQNLLEKKGGSLADAEKTQTAFQSKKR